MLEQIFGTIVLIMLFIILFEGCIACTFGTYEVIKDFLEERKNDKRGQD